MFFASMPMAPSPAGAEGAHRSWAFSFIGIAVLCGMAWSFGPRSSGTTIGARWPSAARALARPNVRAGVAGIVFTVMAFGSAALGANVSHRFPGSAHVGDDARSVSLEGEAVARWMAAHAPVDTPVLADRFVSSAGWFAGPDVRVATQRHVPDLGPLHERRTGTPRSAEADWAFQDPLLRGRLADGDHASARGSLVYADEPGAGGKNLFRNRPSTGSTACRGCRVFTRRAR